MQTDLLTHWHKHIPRHAPLQFLDLLSETLLLAAQEAYLVLQLLHDLRLLLWSEDKIAHLCFRHTLLPQLKSGCNVEV